MIGGVRNVTAASSPTRDHRRSAQTATRTSRVVYANWKKKPLCKGGRKSITLGTVRIVSRTARKPPFKRVTTRRRIRLPRVNPEDSWTPPWAREKDEQGMGVADKSTVEARRQVWLQFMSAAITGQLCISATWEEGMSPKQVSIRAAQVTDEAMKEYESRFSWDEYDQQWVQK